MVPQPLDSLIRASNGAAGSGVPLDASITRIETDTRRLTPGALFVALKGERYDGHDFLDEAARSGAIAALVSRKLAAAPLPLIQVGDTLAALGTLGRHLRRHGTLPVVAVTGSVGKTTTKELIALALSPRFQVLKSEGNQNNEVGVPLTLLEREENHTAAVIELGMRASGEIGYLSRIVEPDAAVITGIGTAHVGRLGSRDAIADAKMEIFEGLRPGGTAILPRDDDYFEDLAARATAIVSFGRCANADLYPTAILDRGIEGVAFVAETPEGSATVSLRVGGEHVVIDSLAALAAAIHLRVPLPEAAAALRHFFPGRGRGFWSRLDDGTVLVDDAYNASPDSVDAALRALAMTPGLERRLAVLGDMLEMGDHAPEGHRRVGQSVARWGLTRLVAVGPESRAVAAEAIVQEMSSDAVCWYPDTPTAAGEVSRWLEPVDAILIKGSNGMKMGIITDAVRFEVNRRVQEGRR